MDRVLKLDLSNPPQEGFDILKNPLQKYPWKIKDNTYTLIKAGNVINHISRENNGFIKFMDECWRVLKIGGQLLISTPYAGSTAFYTDPLNVNPCTAHTWGYFDVNTQYYQAYKPKPWKVKSCVFQVNGIMEVLLEKQNDK